MLKYLIGLAPGTNERVPLLFDIRLPWLPLAHLLQGCGCRIRSAGMLTKQMGKWIICPDTRTQQVSGEKPLVKPDPEDITILEVVLNQGFSGQELNTMLLFDKHTKIIQGRQDPEKDQPIKPLIFGRG